MARPQFQATEETRRQVQEMAGFGLRQEEIATVLNITPKTLRKHFRRELDCGALVANKEVMESLFKMATSGTNTAATIFWVKTRCRVRERERVEEDQPMDTAAEPFVVKVN